jgi:hypothetical protein
VWHWREENCPLCAAPDTPIATPNGERAIADLRLGDFVYSVQNEAIVPVPIRHIGSTRVGTHHVMRVTLDTGRVLEMSPGHPTSDGRTFGDLALGDRFDAQTAVARVERVTYAYDRTYDILPASSTGIYIAAGALVGSTLHTRKPWAFGHADR